MKFWILIGILLIAIGCEQSPSADKQWEYEKTVSLDGINPIGIAVNEEGIWISDGDHNRVVRISESGEILEAIDQLERPMHISADSRGVFIPQYGNDEVILFGDGKKSSLSIADSLDAPAAISVFGEEKAIADFYNQRIMYYRDGEWISIGKEGKADGEFYYPTDVQITDNVLWVADAYNNRIQSFDKTGQHLSTYGKDEKMNAATGIYVGKNQIYVTDFENDRIIIFDHNGNTIQRLESRIGKPTDLMVYDNRLWILNYRKGEIAVFK